MNIAQIEGCTRTIGEAQGYLGLPLRDITLNDSVTGPGTPAMQSAWQPTLGEVAAIAAGAPIILTVLGTAHPPVMIEVGVVSARVDVPGGRDRGYRSFDEWWSRQGLRFSVPEETEAAQLLCASAWRAALASPAGAGVEPDASGIERAMRELAFGEIKPTLLSDDEWQSARAAAQKWLRARAQQKAAANG